MTLIDQIEDLENTRTAAEKAMMFAQDLMLSGLLTPNEVRARFDLEPKAGGDSPKPDKNGFRPSTC